MSRPDYLLLYLLLGITAILLALTMHYYESDAERQVIYKAWTKAHPTCTLTIEDWQTLRHNDLLPTTR